MKQEFVTKPAHKQTLIDLQKAYRNLPFYKRFIFRLATLPFSLWSWSSAKNPATIDPEKTTQQDLQRLDYFFKHCWPAFFRSVFGIMDQFINSELYLSPPATIVTNSDRLSTNIMQHSLGPRVEFSLDDFLTNSQLSAEIKQKIQDNFNRLSNAYHTKGASNAYKLIGALIMINDPRCIGDADELMHKTPTENEVDKHIWSARLKANAVIEAIAGPSRVPDFACQAKQIWQPFNDSLVESLTQNERDNMTNATTYRSIIASVLIPDTLVMGMHPLQDVDRRVLIAFNPRIQFIDESWERDLERYQGNLHKEILDDFNRRTLNINFNDDNYFEAHPYFKFIQDNDQQYERIIFDHACLCGVSENGFLYLQKVLKRDRMIHLQDEARIFSLKRKPALCKMKFTPGKMEGYRYKSEEELNVADKWFVTHAKHPLNKTPYFYACQRTDIPFDRVVNKVNATSPAPSCR